MALVGFVPHLLAAALLATLLLATVAIGQVGSFERIGIGCQSSGKGPIGVTSFNGGSLTAPATQTFSGEYAYAVLAPPFMHFDAFTFYTRTTTGQPETMVCSVYADSGNGTPAPTPVAFGLMHVGPSLGTYTTYLNTRVASSTTPTNFWIAQSNTTTVRPSGLANGLTPAMPTFRRANGNAAWAVTNNVQHPVWWLLSCDGSGGWIPVLNGSEIPRIGGVQTTTLHHAPEGGPAVLIYGFSDTLWGSVPLPLALAPLGGGQCQLRCSTDALVFRNADACGFASVVMPIPNANQLIGVVVFQQWFIEDSFFPNQLGLVSTGLGRSTIGN